MGLPQRNANNQQTDYLASLLDRIQVICDQFRILSLQRQFNACRRVLSLDQQIDVAVLGQFKAGKSSFLNSQTGKPILPVGVIPVTTAITRLTYGEKARVAFSRFLEIFRSLLNQNIERVLGIRLAEVDWKIEVKVPEKPDIRMLRIFDHHIDLLWFLIPMAVFRPFVERHFLNEVPREVTVNLSRLASQCEERINRAIGELKEQTLKYVGEELATLESLLSRAQGQTEEINTAIGELTAGWETGLSLQG